MRREGALTHTGPSSSAMRTAGSFMPSLSEIMPAKLLQIVSRCLQMWGSCLTAHAIRSVLLRRSINEYPVVMAYII